MSAGLTASDSMFSVRVTPWHGLGAVLDRPPASVAEAIEAAGLGWSVIKKPLAVDLGSNLPDVCRYRKLLGHYVTVRQDTDEELGVVGERYTIVQNHEAFAFIDQLLGSAIHFETAGSLHGGRRVGPTSSQTAAHTGERPSTLAGLFVRTGIAQAAKDGKVRQLLTSTHNRRRRRGSRALAEPYGGAGDPTWRQEMWGQVVALHGRYPRALSHPVFDGDFEARVCLAEGEVSAYGTSRKYSKELLDRGTRLVFESGRPIAHVARDLGIESETLRKHVRQTEADEGRRKDVLSSQEREEIKSLRREVCAAAPRERDPEGRQRVFRQASSIHTVRSERVHRRASRALPGRADLLRPWTCRCPPTTSGRPESAQRGSRRG